MKTTAILVAVALFAMVTPASADPLAETCDNEAYFEELLGTRPDNYVKPVVRDLAGDKVAAFGSGDVLMTEEEHTEFIADKAAALAERANEYGACMETLVSGAEETGGFPIVSDFFLLYEVAFDFGQHFCNQGDMVGEGGHYTAATADPAAGSHPWSSGGDEFAGLAESGTSHAETAYYTSAIAADLTTGKAFSYAQDVVYGGSSDFYCFGYFDPFFQDYPTINFPYASGAVAGL